MKHITFLMCLFLAGCSPVYMKQPFPSTVLSGEEQQKFTGCWRVAENDGPLRPEEIFHVAFSSNGVPQLAMLAWEEDTFNLKHIALFVTKHEENYYLSIEDDDKPGQYLFLEMKPTEQGIFVWIPQKDVFSKLVEAGTLAGAYEKGDRKKSLLLTSSAARILEVLADEENAFAYKDPLLLQCVQ